MNRASPQFEYMSLDDFEELLADKPANERWELIGGRVVRMMVGARWEHHLITQNLRFELRRRLDAAMPADAMARRGAMLDLPAISLGVSLAEIYKGVATA